MQQHAFLVEAEAERGVAEALAWASRELGLTGRDNPDVIVLRYGLFSVEDARRVLTLASQAPLVGDNKVIVIAATRAYHEAQNALLKLFEEPPAGTYLFLILPSLGSVLTTLKSRTHVLTMAGKGEPVNNDAEQFIQSSLEKRTALIKKLATGRDEDERRENRDRALALVNDIERALLRRGFEGQAATLSDIATLRGYLYDRSAPVKMILEHLSLVTPKGLV